MIMQGVSGTTALDGSKAATSGQQLQEDLNRFLNLLVTQLQNQDPLDPMDANEFTSQLVQFASVEQQIYQNANLEKLLTVAENGQVAAMVDYLGTIAETSGNALPLEDGQAKASYALGEGVVSTTMAIKDPAGRIMFVAPGETAAGRHTFTWNGNDSSGQALPDGAYSLEVSAKRRDGTLADVIQTAFGRISGASVEGGQVVLFMGQIAVPMDEVLSVQEADAISYRIPATTGDQQYD
jgi:flagellar basal-body rod modification protein FlgD